MAYYDSIAKRWHQTTGYQGGAFKELVLNSILLEKLPGIDRRSILELGGVTAISCPWCYVVSQAKCFRATSEMR